MSQGFTDPYQPPVDQAPGSSLSNLESTEAFRNIAFWQRFFSVLGFIGFGLMMLVLVGQIVMAAASGNGPGEVIGGMVVLAMAFGVGLAVYFIPAYLLGNASTATRQFSEGQISLNEYAFRQRKFWRYTGIAMAIVLSLYAALLVAVFAIAILLGASSRF